MMYNAGLEGINSDIVTESIFLICELMY